MPIATPTGQSFAFTHYYLAKLAIILAVVLSINAQLKVSFFLPIPRPSYRAPLWLCLAVEFFETRGWTVVVALVLAEVWQVAERH